MAAGFVKDAYAASDTVTVPALGFAAGNLVVMCGLWDDATSTVSAINDTGTNDYFVVKTIAANGFTLAMWYSLLDTALDPGDTIVATLAGNDGAWIASEYSGIAASPLDQAPTGVSDVGLVSHTSGTTGTTAQDDELLVGFHGDSGAHTYTATGSFNQTEQQQPFGLSMTVQYRVVASTGTYASTCDTDGSANANNLIGTFLASGAAPPVADTTTRRYQIRHSRMTSW